MKKRCLLHRGFTLIEVLLFLAIFSAVIVVTLPLLFAATEARLRQQTVSLVEENGTQILQNMVRRIRNAERVLDPPLGETGSVLAVQMALPSSNPILFGTQTGTLMMLEGSVKRSLSSSQVAIQNFIVRNTSVSSSKQSVQVSFLVSRTIRLQAPHTYDRVFESVVTLHPEDYPQGAACGCTLPVCTASNLYTWRVCEGSTCIVKTETLECQP